MDVVDSKVPKGKRMTVHTKTCYGMAIIMFMVAALALAKGDMLGYGSFCLAAFLWSYNGWRSEWKD